MLLFQSLYIYFRWLSDDGKVETYGNSEICYIYTQFICDAVIQCTLIFAYTVPQVLLDMNTHPMT